MGPFTFVWIGCRNPWRYERLRSVHDAFLVESCGLARFDRFRVALLAFRKRQRQPRATPKPNESPTGGKTCLLLGAYRTSRTDAWLVGEEMG